MLRKVVAPVIFFIAVTLAGCSLLNHEAPSEDIDKASALFFQRLGAGEFDTIYDDAAEAFKKVQTRQTVTDGLRQIAERGKIINSERISMQFQGENKTRIASPVYRTVSEHATAEITLNFQDEGGEWKLFGFAHKPRS